jgi:hypothetical protein
MINRRSFVAAVAGGAAVSWKGARGWAGEAGKADPPPGVSVGQPREGEDLFGYIQRHAGPRRIMAKASGFGLREQ